MEDSAQDVQNQGGHIVARLFEKLSYAVYSNAIHPKAEIGEETIFFHSGVGCVVHEKAVIGENCTIFQNVTVGSKWEGGICKGGVPIIGNNVFIGAGAVILGQITIGDNAIIGANAVVTNSVPPNAMAVGVPAVIKQRNGY